MDLACDLVIPLALCAYLLVHIAPMHARTSDAGAGRLEFLSARFQYTFGPHEPTLRIQPGAALRVVCPDSDNELADGTVLSPGQRQHETDTVLFEGNPVAGPIYVEGAEPGDCIAVRIEEVILDRARGQTLLAPGHGLLPISLLSHPREDGSYEPVPRHLNLWDIDTKEGVARLKNPLGSDAITVRLNPFVGAIGVAPRWGQSISTLLCGDFGGNMDIPAIRAGATVYLPVFRRGGLVMMGDVHAAQGQGEIIGGAIETSGKIDCTIDLIKGRNLRAPRLRDSSQLMAMGTGADLKAAITQAYAHLLDWLVEGFGMNRWDAYNLMSQTGSVSLGNFGLPPAMAAAAIPIDALPPSRREAPAG